MGGFGYHLMLQYRVEQKNRMRAAGTMPYVRCPICEEKFEDYDHRESQRELAFHMQKHPLRNPDGTLRYVVAGESHDYPDFFNRLIDAINEALKGKKND